MPPGRRTSCLHPARLGVCALAVLVAFCGLGLRLAWLGVVRHRPLALSAVEQRSLSVPLGPTRGDILDRFGRSLTDSRPVYRVAVYPALVPAGSPALRLLAETLGVDPVELEEDLAAGGGAPVFVVNRLNAVRAASVKALGLRGVAVVAGEERYGPASGARHVVGYASLAGAERQGPEVPGEGLAGTDGLERVWDRILTGGGPARLSLFVDGRGRAIPGLGWRKTFPEETGSPWTAVPCDVVTTLNLDVQKAVEAVMDSRVARGAVVVMDPSGGDILAAASRPDYDQNDVASYLSRADGALLNRVTLAYPPGSVFKPLVMAAALEEGVVRPDETFECRGEVIAGGRLIRCHTWPSGHGLISLREALAGSCNVAFVELGRRLGQEGLVEWARVLGFGSPTGAGLPGEQAGCLPGSTPAGPEPEAAFGQGSLLVTPLQVARAYAVLANGGRLVQPRLVERVVAPTGAEAAVARPGPGARVVSRFTAAEVTAALTAAVGEGAGRLAAVADGVAGKTGTAETGRTDQAGQELYHGWFAGYWPAWAPRYVVVVLIEDTPAGGAAAAAVFGEIISALANGAP